MYLLWRAPLFNNRLLFQANTCWLSRFCQWVLASLGKKWYLWAMLVGGGLYIRHVKSIPCGFSAAWIVTTEGSEVHSSHCDKDKKQRFAFLIIYGSLVFHCAMLSWIDFLSEMYCNISCPSKHPLSHFCVGEWWHDRSAVCCTGVTGV